MQESESIKQLGITVQRLGRRAFLSINEKEFDRLIKGRFFQALLVKWQRARMVEQYEKQYVASAAAHSDLSSKKGDRTRWTATTLAKDETVKQEQPKSMEPGAGRRVQ